MTKRFSGYAIIAMALLFPHASNAQAIFEGLYDFPGGTSNVDVRAVSGNGQRVVGIGSAPSLPSALYWNAGSGSSPVSLPQIPGQAAMIGLGVNADGSTIVGQNYSPNGSPAFRWTLGSGTASISPTNTGVYDRAHGTNADGSVVVGTSSSPNQAFRWTASEGMTLLQALSSSEPTADGFGVSGNGLVTVGSSFLDYPNNSAPGLVVRFPRAVSWNGTSGPEALPFLLGQLSPPVRLWRRITTAA
jgi:uncharacterized membrane protein